jgi:membrane protein YqaA with SNARE-associated domain
VKISPVAVLHKITAALVVVLKPLGIWGLGGLALIDSALFPLPTSMDGAVIGYVANDHSKFFFYCLIAAVASAIGSLVPYYIGRAGGELFLLKRINRERYEKMRDRFENQEFLAIMIPAMMPPPMPIKLFEFGAGVFEMKPLRFATAIFAGKMIQFLVCAIITVLYGPAISATITELLHRHAGITFGIVGAILILLTIFLVRKLFDRRRGTKFPLEEGLVDESGPTDAEDATLIT